MKHVFPLYHKSNGIDDKICFSMNLNLKFDFFFVNLFSMQ